MDFEKMIKALNSDRDELYAALQRAANHAANINNGTSGTVAYRLNEIESELHTAGRLIEYIRKLVAGEVH